ncbi:glycosyltransferase [Antarcticibacterium arcticum]|nr:glycosyltransferase [Antarcticibacterium arcticum]
MQVLVIGYVWPEPASSAAGSRMMQILEFLLSTGYTVSFATTASRGPWAFDLSNLGITTAQIELNSSSFDEYLKGLNPTLVIFDRFMMEEQFGWRVNKICPDAIRILDTEDLHFLRNFRELEFKGKAGYGNSGSSDLAKREIASIYRCDLSLIISEAEMQLLISEFKISPTLLFYLPFLFEDITASHISELPAFENRKDFISIGNFRHAPNVDAVVYLKEAIWPLIHKQIPDAKMEIYGAYPSARIEQLGDPKFNFNIKGRVKDAAEVVRKARVSLAPLRFGAGLKGKLAEAMINGTPNVTTSVGAEGMNGSLDWNGVITNDPEEFANAAVNLYNAPREWQQAQNRGFEIINTRFTKKVFYESFRERLSKLELELSKHREANFIGAMLMHHRVKSTYFLSKYIEIKNELEKTEKTKK